MQSQTTINVTANLTATVYFKILAYHKLDSFICNNMGIFIVSNALFHI